MNSKGIKKILATLAVCTATLTPIAACPGMAYAGDSRPLVYGEYVNDVWFEDRIEPSTVHVIEYKGIHYIVCTMVCLYDDAFFSPYGQIPLGKKRSSTTHVIFKFDSDGNTIGNYVDVDKDSTFVSDNVMTSEFEAKFGDTKNPMEWVIKKGTDLDYMDRIAKYVSKNYPSIVSELKSYEAADNAFIKKMEDARKAEEARKREAEEKARMDAFKQRIKPQLEAQMKKVKPAGPAPATYTWDMFMWEGVTPPAHIDINELLNNDWLMTFHRAYFPGAPGLHPEAKNDNFDFVVPVRFVPYFFVDDQTGEILGGTVVLHYLGDGYFYKEENRFPVKIHDFEILPDVNGGELYDQQFKETDEDAFEHKIYCNRENSIVGKRSVGTSIGRAYGSFLFDATYNSKHAAHGAFRVCEWYDDEQGAYVPTGTYMHFEKMSWINVK